MPGASAPSLDQVFRELRGEARAVPPPADRPLSSRTLLIAMLPRTGSTALCSLLEATGVLGMPREYLNPRGPLRPWARRLGARDLEEYLDALRRRQATPNGVFSLKVLYPDLKPLLARGEITEALGPVKFAYLTRDDLVAQAISMYIAEASGVWHRDPSGALFRSRGGGDPDPPYDEVRILEARDELLRQQGDWERFFAERRITPLRLTYEGFVADANGCVGAIAREAGVGWDGEASLDAAATARLADDRSERWAKRLRESGRLRGAVRGHRRRP
jgi:LPS sulfotransferase NodH